MGSELIETTRSRTASRVRTMARLWDLSGVSGSMFFKSGAWI